MDKNLDGGPLVLVLREALESKNLTEHQLAVRTGIASTTLQRRFAGAPFKINEFEAVAEVLGVPAWELLRAADELPVHDESVAVAS